MVDDIPLPELLARLREKLPHIRRRRAVFVVDSNVSMSPDGSALVARGAYLSVFSTDNNADRLPDGETFYIVLTPPPGSVVNPAVPVIGSSGLARPRRRRRRK